MKVLVVEDEKDVRDLMLLHIGREGHDVEGVEDGEVALQKLDAKPYDLAVLDWMLPGVSGLEICKHVRGRIPVLMVTARADSADIVLGLEMGADDYVTKPFEISVFLARVRALLRRAEKKTKGPQEFLNLGPVRLEIESHRAFCEDVEIFLTPSEFKLLSALVENQGKVLSREKLIDLVQGEDIKVIDRAIDTHVFGLRKKLGASGDLIETIRGIGYRVSPQ